MLKEEKILEEFSKIIQHHDHRDNPLKPELENLLKQYDKLNRKMMKVLRLTDKRQEIDKRLNDELSEYERYNEEQQANAKQKELNIIENDLFLRKITAKDNEWVLNIHFEPLETLSGDSYSVKRIAKDRYLLFIVDGMGKGLSPSITAALSVAFINYLVDNWGKEKFTLKELIKKYRQFIETKILDEEIVAVTFVYFKFDKQIIDYSIYGMPPIYIQKNTKVFKKPANNPPMAKFFDSLNMDSFSIKHTKKILISSDGLTENTTIDDTLFAQKVPDVLGRSCFLKTFYEDFKSQCPTQEDDLNIALLYRIPKKTIEKKRFCIISSQQKIDELVAEADMFLEAHGFSEVFRVEYDTVFTELLMNAYEHGNLGLSMEEKRKKIVNDKYDRYLEKKDTKNRKKIWINIKIIKDSDEFFVVTKIKDNGNGFDIKILENLMFKTRTDPYAENGRGILTAKTMAEEVNYNIKGNEVLFVHKEKTKPKEK